MTTKRVCSFVCLAVLAAAVGASGCSEKDASIGPEPGSGGGGGVPDAAGDAAPATACPTGLPGPKLVAVPAANGSFYCIDQREVVNAEYQDFLAAIKGKSPKQPSECGWNLAFEPELYDANDPNDDGLNTGKCAQQIWNNDPSFAAVCVDFCDAFAYCAWAGKRLCGALGAPGNAVNVMTHDQAQSTGSSTSSEWFNACSQGGTTKFPYGDTYVAGRCVDAEKVKTDGVQARSTKEVTGSTCHGTKAPFRDVHHLSGNVWEWGNICDADGCASQGGSRAESVGTSLTCKFSTGSMNAISPFYGFRCCADAVSPASGGGT